MPHRKHPAGTSLLAPVLEWYDTHARTLPWRTTDTTPWEVLVSEVMLQQTPVARVLPVWHEWQARWPEAQDLAAASPGDAVRAWGRLGYPRRALRLHEAATQITDRHEGEVPDDVAALRALPGVGEYTAAAVAVFAFGRRHAVVDTNVRRVHARAVSGRALPAPALTSGESALAQTLLPSEPSTAARWSIAVMELGALVCTARSPQCPRCPLAAACAWRLAGLPPDDGPPRRAQAWHGTDRQVRGRILAVLRDSRGPVPRAALNKASDDVHQLKRCVDSLVSDGLAEPLSHNRLRLPQKVPR